MIAMLRSVQSDLQPNPLRSFAHFSLSAMELIDFLHNYLIAFEVFV